MNCLSGQIGLKCSKTGPDSGVRFFLSELPGIHLAGAVQIADHEQGTGENMLRESIAFAEKMVAIDFAQRIQAKNLSIREIISTEIAGVHGDTFLPVYAGTKGVKAILNFPDDPFVVGRLNYLEVLILNDAPATTVSSTIDGVIQPTYTVDLLAGMNRITLGDLFTRSATVEIDTTAVQTSDGITATVDRSCVDNCDCGPCLSFRSTIDGTPVSTTIEGMRLSASCTGSIDAVVCSFAAALAPAILYRAGAHVMESLISSHRPNPYVRNTKEEAKELYIRWMGGLDARTGFEAQGEYPRLLNQVVQSSLASLENTRSRAFQQTGIRTVYTADPLYHPRKNLLTRKNYGKNGLRLY